MEVRQRQELKWTGISFLSDAGLTRSIEDLHKLGTLLCWTKQPRNASANFRPPEQLIIRDHSIFLLPKPTHVNARADITAVEDQAGS